MLLANSQTLSDEQLTAICEFAEVVSCKCPAYLVVLLRQVRQFRSYTTDCINIFPNDVETHQWLSEQAWHVESFLVQTIFELLEREDLLDEQGGLHFERLGEHSRSNALRQLRCDL